jgi:hypothetical protein
MSWEDILLHDFPDRAIRHLLENRRLLAQLVTAVAPDLADGFDFEGAELLQREFLMEDWRRRESDLLFRVPFRESTEADTALICVLIEHQSAPDPRMPLRLLAYSALYWEREWKEWERDHPAGAGLRLRPIVPIVFHTGTAPWKYERKLAELFGGPELFRKFAPDWPVLFWDLATHPLDELKTAGSDLLRVLSVVRAEHEDIETFKSVLKDVVRSLKSLAESDHVLWHDLMMFILGWIYERRPNAEREQLANAVRTADSSRKRKKEISQMGTLMKGSVAYEKVEFMRDGVILALEKKFKTIPDHIRKLIDEVEDAQRLKAALGSALDAETIEDFRL